MQNELTIQVTQGSSALRTGIEPKLDLIQVMGWPSAPSEIRLNDTMVLDNYDYDENNQVLTVNLDLDMNMNWVLVIME